MSLIIFDFIPFPGTSTLFIISFIFLVIANQLSSVPTLQSIIGSAHNLNALDFVDIGVVFGSRSPYCVTSASGHNFFLLHRIPAFTLCLHLRIG